MILFVIIDALHEDYLPRLGQSGRGFLLWLGGSHLPAGPGLAGRRHFQGLNEGGPRVRPERVPGQTVYQGQAAGEPGRKVHDGERTRERASSRGTRRLWWSARGWR